MLATHTEADEGEIRMLAFGGGSHVRHLKLARDHLMAQPGHDLCYPRESIRALIRDQDTQPLGPCASYAVRTMPTTGRTLLLLATPVNRH
jgi:hypothetical protein